MGGPWAGDEVAAGDVGLDLPFPIQLPIEKNSRVFFGDQQK